MRRSLPWIVLGFTTAVVALVILVPRTDAPLPGVPASPSVSEDSAAMSSGTAGEVETPATAARTEVQSSPEGTDDDLDPSVRAALATFRGRVVHHDGAPAPGCGVRLLRLDLEVLLGDVGDLMADEPVALELDAGETTTDAEGRFTLAGVWPRAFHLLRAGLGTDDPTAIVVERMPGPGEVVDLGDVVLPDGAVLTGTVVDADGEPMQGARVWMLDVPATLLRFVPLQAFEPSGAVLVSEGRQTIVVSMPAWVAERFGDVPVPQALTDADGSFRLSGIPAGVHTLIVGAGGHVTEMRDGVVLEAAEEQDLGTVRMREGEEIVGMVVDASGEPVAGAEVLAGSKQGVAGLAFARPVGPTAADGTFTATGFAPGTVLAAARRHPGEPWVVVGPKPVLADLRIELPSVHDLTVRLRSAAEIEEPRFRLLQGVEGDGAVALLRFGFGDELPLDGRVDVLGERRWRIAGVPAGRWTLLVQAPGHALVATTILVDRDVEQVVELPRATRTDVSVLGPGRAPVAGARVYRETRIGDLPLYAGTTGAAGTVVVEDNPPGRVRLLATHPRFGLARAEALAPVGTVEVVFGEPGRLEGQVLAGDQQAGPWTVAAMPRAAGDSEMPRITAADAEGRFAIAGLQPGEYAVVVVPSLRAMRSLGAWARASVDPLQPLAPRAEERVVIEAGRTSHVTLAPGREDEEIEGPTGRVAGTVNVDGRPGAGMVVAGWSGRGHRVQAVVDRTGAFEIPRVGAGYVQLWVQDPDQPIGVRLWHAMVDVEADSTATVAVDIETTSVAGRVVDPEGAPLGGGGVGFQGRGDGATAMIVAPLDDGGRFRVDRLPAGRYAIWLEWRGGSAGLAVQETLDVQRGVPVRDLVLRARPTVTASGTVDASALEGTPQHVHLTLSHTGSGVDYEVYASAEGDGRFRAEGLIAGTYRVLGWVTAEDGRGASVACDDTVIVGRRDVDGVVLRLRPDEQEARVITIEDDRGQ